MKGYLDDPNTSFTFVQITGIPAAYTTDDVYVYFDGGNGSATRSANYSLLALDWRMVAPALGQSTRDLSRRTVQRRGGLEHRQAAVHSRC